MLDLEALQANFKKANTSNHDNNYYQFWNMKEGESCIIRFLPDADTDNPLGFTKEKVTHQFEVNGEKKTIPCLSMYDQPCPICKTSAEFYKNKDTEQGKLYWKRRAQIAQILVIKDPLPAADGQDSNSQGKYMMISLGKQLFDIVKEGMTDVESMPFLFENGYDFVIKKTKQGDYASYALGSKFVNKQSALTPDQIEIAETGMVELKDALPKQPELEYVENMLNAALTGEVTSDNNQVLQQTSIEELTGTNTVAGETKQTDEQQKKSEALLERIKARKAA